MPNFWRTGAPRILKIQRFPLNMAWSWQKACILGPTIFKIPQPNWHYCIPFLIKGNITSDCRIFVVEWECGALFATFLVGAESSISALHQAKHIMVGNLFCHADSEPRYVRLSPILSLVSFRFQYCLLWFPLIITCSVILPDTNFFANTEEKSKN